MVSAAEQEECIATVTEVTGLNHDGARHLLLATDWSVENAVAVHFAGGDGGSPNPTVNAMPIEANRVEEVDATAAEEDNLEVAPPPQPGFFGSIGRAVGSAWQSVMGIASEDFDDWFLQRFGTPKPTFCQTHFGDTVRQALTDQRLILLFFFCKDDLATQQLGNDVFQNPLILRTLARSYIVWGGDVCRFEPAQLARLLGVSILPGLCVLQPLPNGFEHAVCLEWPLGTFALPLFRLGPLRPGMPLNTEECITALSGAAQEHQAAVSQRQMQQQRQTRRLEEERQLKAQQDREYEEALLADQLRQVEKLEKPEEKMEDVHMEQAKQVVDVHPSSSSNLVDTQEPTATSAMDVEPPEKLTAEEEAQWRLRGEQILAEPEPAAAGAATARIQLKLPCGRRMQRTFVADKLLSDLLEWADYCRPERDPVQFELCTTFPVKALDDKSASLSSLGLTPSAVLVLRAVD